MPRLVKKDLKVIAFNIIHRRTSEAEDPSMWLFVEIHLISGMKCLWKCVNSASCRDFEIPLDKNEDFAFVF